MERTITWQNENKQKIFARRFHDDDENLNKANSVIVLVHGLGEHSGRYQHWADRFQKEGIALYGLDIHGHGLTSGRRGHTESFGSIYEDIKHLLAKARSNHPKAKIHLYGHSMGGALALGFSVLRASAMTSLGLTSTITTGTAIRPGFEPPAWKIKLAAILEAALPGLALGNELDPAWLSSDPHVVAAYQSDPLVHDRISVRWYNEWMRTIATVREHASQLPVPLLMLHGEDDKATSCAAARSIATDLSAEFKSWPGARHEIHNEPCQGEVFQTILTWIQSR